MTPEADRLNALARYAVLDTLPENAFDRVTRIAARLFHAPIALVTLVDQDRQWFKACLGLDLRQTDRSVSFCTYTIQSDGVMVILDATRDPLFEHNPLVTGAPHIRFYAGAPLVTPDGFRLGSLCVIDQRPRETFPESDRALLTDLAQSVVTELELRFTQRTLTQEAEARAGLLRTVQDAQTLAEALLGVSQLTNLDLSVEETATFALPLTAHSAGVDWAALLRLDHVMTALTHWTGSAAGEAFHAALPDQLPRGEGLAWQVADRDTPHYAHDYAQQDGAAAAVAQAGGDAVAYVPLGAFHGAQYVAAYALTGTGRAWSARQRELLEASAGIVRQAMWNRHQREQPVPVY
ncbi:GAF domain-containing protein [Deinococcus sp. JMULE3]|uniref:GAF domain-containing protein n=1 Tax=Deinococcus sp. JMULE3 TaxID=2518341 RepID=UPI0015755FF5|nr:GAF domain-containing protein [Deinococcus sp. JMULE3]